MDRALLKLKGIMEEMIEMFIATTESPQALPQPSPIAEWGMLGALLYLIIKEFFKKSEKSDQTLDRSIAHDELMFDKMLETLMRSQNDTQQRLVEELSAKNVLYQRLHTMESRLQDVLEKLEKLESKLSSN